MKILFSHFGIYKKGGWGRTFMLAKGLASHGNDITLLTLSHRKGLSFEKKYINGVKVIIFQDILPQKVLAKGFGLISLILKLIYSLFHSFDIVHADSHRPNAYYPCLINRNFYSSKLFIEWWDNFGPEGQLPNKNKWFKYFLGNWETRTEISSKINADGVIVLSQFMYERAISLGISDDCLEVLRGGSNIDDIKSLPFNYLIKNKYNIDEKTTTFGFIGSGDADLSDLKPFLEAMSELKNTYNFKLLNYGMSFNQRSKTELSLNNLILECGWIDYDNNSLALAAVDYFILIKESNIENISGWPNKLGDYLSCGRPVLLNLYGDLVSFHAEYQPGFIIVKYAKDDIKEKIIEICNGKYDKYKLGKINRAIAEKYMSWNERSLQLEQFYLRKKSL